MQQSDTKLFLLFCALSVFLYGVPVIAQAQEASLYLAPRSGTFFVGSIFDISVFLNTEGNSIHTVRADLKFPPDKLQVTSPTAGDSFISVWAEQPFYSNREGIISFKGGVPHPGINTSAGLVSTISFRAKTPGVATISFLDSSQVLVADPQVKDILKTSTGGNYTLIIRPPEGPEIFSSTHPSLTVWYRDNNPSFFWEKDSEVTDYSWSFDQDPKGVPDNIPEAFLTQVSLSDVTDGLWYFHLKARKGKTWGGVSHYPVRIDTTSPRDFSVEIEKVSIVSQFFADFSTSDFVSGIDYYEVAFVNLDDPQAAATPFFIEAFSPTRIPYETSGKYVILVRAYDNAGNYTESKSTLTIVSPLLSYTERGIRIRGVLLPWFLLYALLVAMLVALGYVMYRLWHRKTLGQRLKKEVSEAEKEIEDVRKLEERIRKMRALEEEAIREGSRLAGELRGKEPPPENKSTP